MQLSTQSTAARIFPLDVLKALSILAVVFFHALFVPSSAFEPIVPTLDILLAPLRFCVPVFLTISFFLLQRGIENNSGQSHYFILKKRLLRLLVPTIFWFSVALLIKKFIWFTRKEDLLVALLQGTIYPGSYYLLALLQLVPLFILFNPWFNRHRAIAVTLILQCLTFLGIYMALSGTFADWIPQILAALHRPFLIYWFVYMALGTFLYKHWSSIIKISRQISAIAKIFLLVVSGICLAVETTFLNSLSDSTLAPYEYMMLSCILSVFVCFLCFASITEDRLPIIGRKIIKLLSKYSLGIYCINGVAQTIFYFIFVKTFPSITLDLAGIFVMKIVGTALLLSVSIGLSLLIDKVGGRALVR